jgi:hypothetical protein
MTREELGKWLYDNYEEILKKEKQNPLIQSNESIMLKLARRIHKRI